MTPTWKYTDARGVEHKGIMMKFFYNGGSDITYMMKSDKGEIDLISGSLINKMRRVEWK